MFDVVFPGEYPLQHRNNWKIPDENGDRMDLSKELYIVQSCISHIIFVELKTKVVIVCRVHTLSPSPCPPSLWNKKESTISLIQNQFYIFVL